MLHDEAVYPDPLIRIDSLVRTATLTNQSVIRRMLAGVSEDGMFKEFKEPLFI